MGDGKEVVRRKAQLAGREASKGVSGRHAGEGFDGVGVWLAAGWAGNPPTQSGEAQHGVPEMLTFVATCFYAKWPVKFKKSGTIL